MGFLIGLSRATLGHAPWCTITLTAVDRRRRPIVGNRNVLSSMPGGPRSCC